MQVGHDEVGQTRFLGGIENLGEWGDAFLGWIGHGFPSKVGGIDREAKILGRFDHWTGIGESVGLDLFVARVRDCFQSGDGIFRDLISQGVELDANVLTIAVVFSEGHGLKGG